MEWSKVKNIIILILLTVNVFLLVQTVGQERQSREYREEARAGAIETLQRQGYTVAEDALPQERRLTAMTAERDRESEEKLAQSLLGAVKRTDDGVRVSYTGEKGECSFRSNGSFSVTFAASAYPLEGDTGRHAVKILTDAGYSCVPAGSREGDGATVISVRQTWEGVNLFSCTAELTYADGELKSIAGSRLFGTPARDSGGGETMDVPTALVRFMSAMREAGHVFTEVERMELGYLTSGSGRRLQLTPTWRFTTDAGSFFMSALTGDLNQQ